MANLENVTMEDVRLIFRNFAGKEGQYNAEGDRNFGVVLPPDVAEAMARDGWAVKWLRAREEGEEDTPWLQVSVKYRGRAGNKVRPPKVVMITSRNRTFLDEDMIEMLDYADIRTVDLIVRPYAWAVRDASGVKAYLQTMFVTIEEDALELKYAPMMDHGRDEDED